MDSPRGRLFMIFILACLFSDIAGSLKNEDNPSDYKASGISRRERASTQVKEILPVEVNVGGLVKIFNQQIQKLGDNVTRLDNQLRIIKANEERNLESCKAELETSRNELEEEVERSKNEGKSLEEEVERNSAAQNSLKEEIYRLKNESTSIKAENERLKMKLEATPHETGIPQGTSVLMENIGTPGASSVYGFNLPKYAFQNSSNYWSSISRLPQSIWIKLATPCQIAKLGFSSEGNMYAPRRFDIIGSSNCADPWTVLLHVADSGFTKTSRSQFKTWTVPQQNRRAFKCIGLKIETTYKCCIRYYSGDYVALKNIQMWGRDRCSSAENSLKEENYRLKNENTAIKAENERLKMKLEATSHKTGIPQGSGLTCTPLTWSFILGSCIHSYDQDGWILLQQRTVNATSNDDNIFARMKWNNYRDGFEDPGIAYWYGLQKMHEKTSSGRWKVALVFRCGGDDQCAVFNDFKIDGENEKFKLHVGAEVSRKGFPSGLTLDYNNEMAFTTSDSDNDKLGSRNCAAYSTILGGWWHKACAYYCPNCQKLNDRNPGCTHTFMVMKRI